LSDSDRVWVTGNSSHSRSGGHVHSDPSCPALASAKNTYPRQRSELDPDEDDLCELCETDIEGGARPGQDVNATRKQLLNTDPEDLGLSPIDERRQSGEPMTDGGQLRGPPKCPNCGHDPDGDDETFTSGGGWIFDNSIADGIWTEELHCPVCKDVVAREEKSMGAGGGLR